MAGTVRGKGYQFERGVSLGSARKAHDPSMSLSKCSPAQLPKNSFLPEPIDESKNTRSFLENIFSPLTWTFNPHLITTWSRNLIMPGLCVDTATFIAGHTHNPHMLLLSDKLQTPAVRWRSKSSLQRVQRSLTAPKPGHRVIFRSY